MRSSSSSCRLSLSLVLVSCLVAPVAAQGTIGFGGGGGAGGQGTVAPTVPGLENDSILRSLAALDKAKVAAVGRVISLERVDEISRRKATGRDGFQVLERHRVVFKVSEVLRGKLSAGKTIKAEFRVRIFTTEPDVEYTEGLCVPRAKLGDAGVLLLERKGRTWHSVQLVMGSQHDLAIARGEFEVGKQPTYPPEEHLAHLSARAHYFMTLSKLQAALAVLKQARKRTRTARAASKWATKGLAQLSEHKQVLARLRLAEKQIGPFADELKRVGKALKAEQARLRL